MDLALTFANNFLILLDAMAIYILVGLFFAGILKQFIPDNFVSKHLGEGNVLSVIKATILGIPLPVCSCSVIPLAQGLKKEGASKGAVQSFLISTPITGVDSILATYSFFGFFFTLFRIFSSIIIAIVVGILQNIFDDKKEIYSSNEKTSCCSSTCCSKNDNKGFSIKEALKYSYVTLFSDMVKPLFIGLLLGALFTTFAPKEYTQLLFQNQFLTYIVILVFSIPLYVCATASLPIAAALMLQGMSAGAAFIFLTAGPATSIITMSIVYKILGKKSLVIYISSIMILSLFFGFLFDSFYSEINVLNFVNELEHSSMLSQISSMILLLMIFFYLIKAKFKKRAKFSSKINDSNYKILNNEKKQIDFTKVEFKK